MKLTEHLSLKICRILKWAYNFIICCIKYVRKIFLCTINFAQYISTSISKLYHRILPNQQCVNLCRTTVQTVDYTTVKCTLVSYLVMGVPHDAVLVGQVEGPDDDGAVEAPAGHVHRVGRPRHTVHLEPRWQLRSKRRSSGSDEWKT